MNEKLHALLEKLRAENKPTERGRALVEELHRQAAEKYRGQPSPPMERPTIHYTEIPPAEPDSLLYREWNTYRREVGRLLAEGHEGKYVLIKETEIFGIWDTMEEGKVEANRRFLHQPFLLRQILSREPIVRGPTRFYLCRS